MSRLNDARLQAALSAILDIADRKLFVESVDLQIGLKNYDPNRERRFSGNLKLPHMPRPRMTVCVLADAFHADQATQMGIPYKTVEDLKKLNRNKKLVKKFAQEYDAFLASESLIRQIPRLVGPGLNRASKFPTAVSHSESLRAKVDGVRKTIRFQLKKHPCFGCAIGHVGMAHDELRLNIVLALNFLITLLKRGWQNVDTVHIKSTMGTSQRIF